MRIWMILSIFVVLVIPFILKADLTKKILFSNKGYAKEIEVKTYILTQEQLVEIFKNSNIEPVQMTVNDINKESKTFFLVRVKNLGSQHAWGVLDCKLPNIGLPIELPIINIKKYYCDYVICLSGIVISQENNNTIPLITYKWSELYTK